MSRAANTRRDFVQQLGVLSVAGIAPSGELAVVRREHRVGSEVPRHELLLTRSTTEGMNWAGALASPLLTSALPNEI